MGLGGLRARDMDMDRGRDGDEDFWGKGGRGMRGGEGNGEEGLFPGWEVKNTINDERS